MLGIFRVAAYLVFSQPLAASLQLGIRAHRIQFCQSGTPHGDLEWSFLVRWPCRLFEICSYLFIFMYIHVYKCQRCATRGQDSWLQAPLARLFRQSVFDLKTCCHARRSLGPPRPTSCQRVLDMQITIQFILSVVCYRVPHVVSWTLPSSLGEPTPLPMSLPREVDIN